MANLTRLCHDGISSPARKATTSNNALKPHLAEFARAVSETGRLSGSEARLGEVSGLLSGLLAVMTLLLIGFAPVAWLFSQSTQSVLWMGVLHLLFWFVAACFGFRFLQAGFAHTRARSAAGLMVWAVIFTLVMLQMNAALRPLVGTSETLLPKEKKFFLKHWGDSLIAAERDGR